MHGERDKINCVFGKGAKGERDKGGKGERGRWGKGGKGEEGTAAWGRGKLEEKRTGERGKGGKGGRPAGTAACRDRARHTVQAMRTCKTMCTCKPCAPREPCARFHPTRCHAQTKGKGTAARGKRQGARGKGQEARGKRQGTGGKGQQARGMQDPHRGAGRPAEPQLELRQLRKELLVPRHVLRAGVERHVQRQRLQPRLQAEVHALDAVRHVLCGAAEGKGRRSREGDWGAGGKRVCVCACRQKFAFLTRSGMGRHLGGERRERKGKGEGRFRTGGLQRILMLKTIKQTKTYEIVERRREIPGGEEVLETLNKERT
eukprot:364205-Chlamydomonas_euryale.AAC.1